MLDRLLLWLMLCIFSIPLHAESSNQGLNGTWVSKGQQEVRTLSLNDNGKGRFVSDHPQGSCDANLNSVVESHFAMASGLVPNCQQTDINRIRCKIRSTHEKYGNIQEGASRILNVSNITGATDQHSFIMTNFT